MATRIKLTPKQRREVINYLLAEAGKGIFEDVSDLWPGIEEGDNFSAYRIAVDAFVSKVRRRALALEENSVWQELQTVFTSCYEGLDGTWDPTGEGAEAFEAMADKLQAVARKLKLAPLVRPDEPSDEQEDD